MKSAFLSSWIVASVLAGVGPAAANTDIYTGYNTVFGSGAPTTCNTCHTGSPTPFSASYALFSDFYAYRTGNTLTRANVAANLKAFSASLGQTYAPRIGAGAEVTIGKTAGSSVTLPITGGKSFGGAASLVSAIASGGSGLSVSGSTLSVASSLANQFSDRSVGFTLRTGNNFCQFPSTASSACQTFTVTVHLSDNAPTVGDASFGLAGGASSGSFEMNDVDGDNVTVTVATAPSVGQVTLSNTSAPSGGSVTGGQFSYSGGGQTPTVTFTIEYWATSKPSEKTQQLITLASGNTAPNARDDAATVAMNGAFQGNVITGFQNGPADTDTETPNQLTAALKSGSGPTKGAAQLSSNGALTYTPDQNATGIDSFVYVLTDGGGFTDEATVTFTIVDTTPPITAADATIPVVLTKGTQQTFERSLVSSVSNPTKAKLAFREVAGTRKYKKDGGGGSKAVVVSLASSGGLTVKPAARWAGQVTFDYQVTSVINNGVGDFSKAKRADVTITISAGEVLRTLKANDFGRLEFRRGDDSVVRCYRIDPFFGVNLRATYDYAPTQALIPGPFTIDSQGIFLSGTGTSGIVFDPFFPARFPAGSKLRVNCDGDVSLLPLGSLPTNDVDETLARKALIPNQAPLVFPTTAELKGTKVRSVPPGTIVEVLPEIVDADGLTFEWKATGGTVFRNKGKTTLWKLPPDRGLYKIYVLASDGRGSVVQSAKALTTDVKKAVADNVKWPLPEGTSTAVISDSHFLSFFYNKYNSNPKVIPDDANSACLYYQHLGVASACTADGKVKQGITIAAWRKKWGFGSGNTSEVRALYRNIADLGLQRRMEAIRTKAGAAYNVCNHDPNLVNGAGSVVVDRSLSNAISRERFVACVAMEYSGPAGNPGGKRFTKFLVFGPDGKLLTHIDLDGRGEKFVPGVCVACHGALGGYVRYETPTGRAKGDIGAKFLPFDIDNFAFSDRAAFSEEKQLAALRRMNLLLLETDPTPAARELINGWYPKGSKTFHGDFVPKAWKDEKQLYLRVVRPSCRGCHVSLPNGPNFGTLAEFAGRGALIKSHVCGYRNGSSGARSDDLLYSMPNALVTFDRFWDTGFRIQPKLLADFLVRRKLLPQGSTCDPPVAD